MQIYIYFGKNQQLAQKSAINERKNNIFKPKIFGA